MKDFDKIAFLSTLNEEVVDYRASERLLAEMFLSRLEAFLNPHKFQVIYRELGEVKLTKHKYANKAEFVKEFTEDAVFIRLLNKALYYDENGIRRTSAEEFRNNVEFYAKYPNCKLIRLI